MKDPPRWASLIPEVTFTADGSTGTRSLLTMTTISAPVRSSR